jgi:hypothetical protein
MKGVWRASLALWTQPYRQPHGGPPRPPDDIGSLCEISSLLQLWRSQGPASKPSSTSTRDVDDTCVPGRRRSTVSRHSSALVVPRSARWCDSCSGSRIAVGRSGDASVSVGTREASIQHSHECEQKGQSRGIFSRTNGNFSGGTGRCELWFVTSAEPTKTCICIATHRLQHRATRTTRWQRRTPGWRRTWGPGGASRGSRRRLRPAAMRHGVSRSDRRGPIGRGAAGRAPGRGASALPHGFDIRPSTVGRCRRVVV